MPVWQLQMYGVQYTEFCQTISPLTAIIQDMEGQQHYTPRPPNPLSPSSPSSPPPPHEEKVLSLSIKVPKI
jgi:hypothetical protein